MQRLPPDIIRPGVTFACQVCPAPAAAAVHEAACLLHLQVWVHFIVQAKVPIGGHQHHLSRVQAAADGYCGCCYAQVIHLVLQGFQQAGICGWHIPDDGGGSMLEVVTMHIQSDNLCSSYVTTALTCQSHAAEDCCTDAIIQARPGLTWCHATMDCTEPPAMHGQDELAPFCMNLIAHCWHQDSTAGGGGEPTCCPDVGRPQPPSQPLVNSQDVHWGCRCPLLPPAPRDA